FNCHNRFVRFAVSHRVKGLRYRIYCEAKLHFFINFQPFATGFSENAEEVQAAQHLTPKVFKSVRKASNHSPTAQKPSAFYHEKKHKISDEMEQNKGAQ
ncbi:MAG: hypothetical protein IKT26_04060, partial [Bacteroidaceae bacterium]|nr:hypothetical protein [Bacteroidaceae bacterium]